MNIKILLPLFLGFLTSLRCTMTSEAGGSQPQRPPPSIFGIAWTVLYLLIGVAWSKSTTILENRLFWILNLLLCGWLVAWSCMDDKKLALYIIYLSLTCALGLVKVSPNGLLIVPLVGWLTYASNLNWHALD